MTTLGHLANNTRRLARDDTKTRYDHIGRYDGAIENPDIILNYSEFPDDDVCADMDVASDGGGLDDGCFADEDVVS